jgi:hypothetical protein
MRSEREREGGSESERERERESERCGQGWIRNATEGVAYTHSLMTSLMSLPPPVSWYRHTVM